MFIFLVSFCPFFCYLLRFVSLIPVEFVCVFPALLSSNASSSFAVPQFMELVAAACFRRHSTLALSLRLGLIVMCDSERDSQREREIARERVTTLWPYSHWFVWLDSHTHSVGQARCQLSASFKPVYGQFSVQFQLFSHSIHLVPVQQADSDPNFTYLKWPQIATRWARSSPTCKVFTSTLPLLRTPPSAHASPVSMRTSSSISNGSASIPSPTQACATCRVQATPRSSMALRPRAANPPSVLWRHRCRRCRRCWSCVSWYIRRVTASTGKTPCTGASSSARSSRWTARRPFVNPFPHSFTSFLPPPAVHPHLGQAAGHTALRSSPQVHRLPGGDSLPGAWRRWACAADTALQRAAPRDSGED